MGIIANPASGKDIRRLVAYGSVFDNNEKVNIVKRVILGLDSMGVKEIVFMPDYFGIGVRAMEDLDVCLAASFLDMQTENTQDDSVQKTHKAVVIQEAVEVAGVASQVVKGLVDSSFEYLDAPIKTVAAGNSVIPFSPPLEDAMLPNEEKIMTAVKEVLS